MHGFFRCQASSLFGFLSLRLPRHFFPHSLFLRGYPLSLLFGVEIEIFASCLAFLSAFRPSPSLATSAAYTLVTKRSFRLRCPPLLLPSRSSWSACAISIPFPSLLPCQFCFFAILFFLRPPVLENCWVLVGCGASFLPPEFLKRKSFLGFCFVSPRPSHLPLDFSYSRFCAFPFLPPSCPSGFVSSCPLGAARGAR